jgi:hypothetical protein
VIATYGEIAVAKVAHWRWRVPAFAQLPLDCGDCG